MRNIPYILAGSIAGLFQRRPKLTRAGLLLAALSAVGGGHSAKADNTWDGGGGGTFIWSNNVN